MTIRKTNRLQMESLEDRRLLAGLDSGGAFRWTNGDQLSIFDPLASVGTPAMDSFAGTDDAFGTATTTGDFNGDGNPDLAISVPSKDFDGEPDVGAVHIIYGVASGLSTRNNEMFYESDFIDDRDSLFGRSLAAGDFNGDGFDDLAIGGFEKVIVVDGFAGGLDRSTSREIEPWDPGIELLDFDGELVGFGHVLATGQLAASGDDALIIGAPEDHVDGVERAGSIVVMYGASIPQVWNQNSIGIEGESEGPVDFSFGDRFGSALATGDFDNNGFDDVAIGVFGEDNENTVFDDIDAGAVNVIFSTPAGLTSDGNQFIWQDTDGVDGETEDGDFFGSSLAAGDFNGDNFVDLAIGVLAEDIDETSGDTEGAVNVVYGSSEGLVGTDEPMWHQARPGVLGKALGGDRFGSHLTSADFDGDGLDDLAIGSPFDTAVEGGPRDGSVNVLYGSDNGVVTNGGTAYLHDDQNKMQNNNGHDLRFGRSLAAADFDGNGAADLVIGVPGADAGNGAHAGHVIVLPSFGAGGPSTFDHQVFHQDLPAEVPSNALSQFGHSLSTGDFNNDGRDDVVFTAPRQDIPEEHANPFFRKSVSGAAYLNYTSSGGFPQSGTSEIIIQDLLGFELGSEGFELFGFATASGDFDGDGFTDLAISAPRENLLQDDGSEIVNAGVVHVIMGSINGLTNEVYHLTQGAPNFGLAERGDLFGLALVAGDFNGDGRDDLAVGTPNESLNPSDRIGQVDIFFGSLFGAPGSNQALQLMTGASINGTIFNERFGDTLAVGDFDNDGFEDLVVGAPRSDVAGVTNAGAAAILYGSPSGVDTQNPTILTQAATPDSLDLFNNGQANDRFGSSLAVGDFDDNGFDDLAIGVPYEDVATDDFGTQRNAGVVNVVYGGSAGITTEDQQIWQQDRGFRNQDEADGFAESGDQFGAALVAADVNGDGTDDLIVGVPGEDITVTNEGAINTIFGDDGNGLDEDDSLLQTSINFGYGGIAQERFGSRLVSGNFNFDNIDDVVVSAPRAGFVGTPQSGMAYTIFGSTGFVPASNDQFSNAPDSDVARELVALPSESPQNSGSPVDVPVAPLAMDAIDSSRLTAIEPPRPSYNYEQLDWGRDRSDRESAKEEWLIDAIFAFLGEA